MGNANSSAHDAESWALADLFADGSIAVDSIKHENYAEDPQLLDRMLRTLQWPSGLSSTVTLEMFHKILDQEVFYRILGQNLKTGGIPLLIKSISTILLTTGTQTWDEMMVSKGDFVPGSSIWESSIKVSENSESPINIDAMFALAQFTFLFLTFLMNHLTLHEYILHVEYPIVPEVLLCSSTPDKDNMATPNTPTAASAEFLIFLGIPKSLLKESLDTHPSLPPSSADLAEWETVGIQLPLKDFGKLPPTERGCYFIQPLRKALKSWLGAQFDDIIDQGRLRFVTGHPIELKTLDSLSSLIGDAILHTRVFNPQEPIVSCAIIVDNGLAPSGVLGGLIRSTLHFLINTYQAFFFSDRLSPKACPIATRIECHKSWLSCLLSIMSIRGLEGNEVLSETSFAAEIEGLGKRFQALDEARRASLRSQLRIARQKLGMTTSVSLLPPMSLYRSSCLDSAALINTSSAPEIGMDLVDSVIEQSHMSDELLYYLLNVYFLYVRGQPIPLTDDDAASDDPFRQLETYFSVCFPTIVKRPSIATYGELYSYHKAIGYCVNWNTSSRDIAQLSPCLAFDFLPLSLRVTASSFLLLLCNRTRNIMEKTLEKFQAFSVLSLVSTKKPTKLLFYKSIEDCCATMAISSRLRSQTGFAMFYTLTTKNALFGSAPLVSEKSPEIILSILELLISIMILDNSKSDKGLAQSNLLTLHSSHPSVHMSLSILLSLSSRESFGEHLINHILPSSPAWLFASSPTSEQTAAEQKRIARLQGRIKNLSLGHVLCQVCLRLMEWNLRLRKETIISEYLIAILHNLKTFPRLDLHWSVCENMVASIEGAIKIMLSRLASPHVLASVISSTDAASIKGFETLNSIDFVTNHLELLAAHIQALSQFAASLILPENVTRNPLMLYTLVRHGTTPFEYIRQLCKEVDASNIFQKHEEIARMIETSTDLTCLYITKQLCVYRFITRELLHTCVYLEDAIRACLIAGQSFELLSRACRQLERIADCQEAPPLLESESQRFEVSPSEEGKRQDEKGYEDEREEDESTPDQIAKDFASRRASLVTRRLGFHIHTDATYAYRILSYQEAIRALSRATAHAVPLRETLQGLTSFIAWDVLYSYLLRPYLRGSKSTGDTELGLSPQFKTPSVKRPAVQATLADLGSPTVGTIPPFAVSSRTVNAV